MRPFAEAFQILPTPAILPLRSMTSVFVMVRADREHGRVADERFGRRFFARARRLPARC